MAIDPLRSARRLGLYLWPIVPPAALAAIVTLAVSQGNEYMHSILIIGLINLLFVIALYSFAGTSGVFSFGHIAFAAIGAYSAGVFAVPVATKQVLFASMPSGLVHLHAGALLSTLIGGAVAAVAGALTSIPLMRLGGLAASIATFALLIIVHVVAQNLNQVTNGLSGMSAVPITTTPGRVLVWCVIAMAVVYLFQQSRLGLRLRSSREDEVAARACGVSVFNERRVAWIISAFFMGIGGALYGQFLGTFDADAFYLDITFLVIAMLVVGGRHSLAGAVVGSVFISIVSEALRQIEEGPTIGPVHIPARPGLHAVGLALIMLAVLILRPSGLAGGHEITWPFTRPIREMLAGQGRPSAEGQAASDAPAVERELTYGREPR
jgi:branched-chain amino acid transport system permease protein